MTDFKIAIHVAITGEILITAEDEEHARELALAQFVPTGEPPQTLQMWVEKVEELAPKPKLINGYAPEEWCADHQMPRVMVGGKLKCPHCEGAHCVKMLKLQQEPK